MIYSKNITDKNSTPKLENNIDSIHFTYCVQTKTRYGHEVLAEMFVYFFYFFTNRNTLI